MGQRLDSKRASEYSKLTTGTLHMLVQSGELNEMWDNGFVYYDTDELDAVVVRLHLIEPYATLPDEVKEDEANIITGQKKDVR